MEDRGVFEDVPDFRSGPTVKCYTFLETSHDPLQELPVISNFFLKIEITQPLPIRKDLKKYKHFQGFH